MPDLPTGTVTLLFTDIEASTRLLRSLGDGYERALSDHRILLRRAFNLTGGQVVDRQGDSFFVVFRRAKDALTAAVDAQRALASHPWPDGLTLRVRMGIHTGEPAVNDEGLTGLAVHRAARICATAKGEQVLVSSTTRDLVEDELPPGTELRDLGEFALKDFDRPARLFQVVAEGLRESFAVAPAVDEGASEARSGSEADADVAARRLTTAVRAEEISKPTSMGSVRGALGAVIPRPIRRRLGNDPIVIGSRIHSMARLSSSPELAAALRALGGALIQVVRCQRDVQRTLRATDRRALRRRLDSLRADHFLTKEEARVADDLAAQVEALDRLAHLRPVLRAEIERGAAQAKGLQEQVFNVRRGRPLTEGLIDELNAQCLSIQSLCADVQETEQHARGLNRPIVGDR
jgi:class 3 adenylate cyclase